VTQGNRVNGTVPPPTTVIVDDSTGKTGGVPLKPDIATAITNDPYFTDTYVTPGFTTSPTISPSRSNGAPACDLPLTNPPTPSNCRDNNGFSGSNITPGTDKPNTVQQQYFTDVITRTILPNFKDQGKPFVMVYWSRDPDGTQHNQGDSLNSVTPGINGPTAKLAAQNVDQNIKQVLTYLKASGLADNTDVFVTADHGFSTISRSLVNSAGTRTTSYAATLSYTGINPGFLPNGFVAIDLANSLGQPLYDPDTPTVPLDVNNNVTYALVTPTATTPTPPNVQRPKFGNGIIGGTGKVVSGKTDGNIVIAANGGSDLIYLPNGNPVQSNGKTLAANIVAFLTTQDYTSGLFADDAFGNIPGALPLSAINLKGSALTPVPAIVVNFRSFATDLNNPVNTAVEIADTGLQQGQGMHGSFSRGDTFNNMAAIGPDFKQGYQDKAPTSNADVVPTLAKLLNLSLPSKGTLVGRALSEAFVDGSEPPSSVSRTMRSTPASNGLRTILNYQQVGDQRVGKTLYFDAAGFLDRTVGLNSKK
jgi:arylsulfatase A-like enzyme